ncbi:S-adenosylmethionine/S-adenosylhomocysteine transporter [Candidatus Dependentiae bacterium Noda2021]|nr:S-adenosylmethionine/S-adenosylhomocysteine transporter [Candidatus Dependentiae bacterium Noda2021]
MFLLVLLNAITGATYPIAKAALNFAPAIFMTAMRMFIAGILIIGWEWLRGSCRYKFDKQGVALLAALVLFNVYLTNVLQFWALNYVGAGKAAFIANLTPFISALLAYFFFKESFSVKKLIGLSIGFLSFIPLIISQPTVEAAVETASRVGYWPEIALVVSTLMSVLGWLAMKRLMQVQTNCIMMANGLSMLIGSFLFFPTSWAVETRDLFPVSNVPYFLLSMAGLIFVNNLVSYNGFAFLMGRYSTTLLFFGGFLNPLFASLYGWYFLGEEITWQVYVAVAGVVVGLILFYLDEKKANEDKNSKIYKAKL